MLLLILRSKRIFYNIAYPGIYFTLVLYHQRKTFLLFLNKRQNITCWKTFFLYCLRRKIFIIYKEKYKYYVIEIDARRQINLSC